MTRSLWAISPTFELAVVVEDPGIYRELNKGGINPSIFRSTLSKAFGTDGPVLSLADRKKFITDKSIAVPDFVLWNWVPVLTERARKLMLALGAPAEDFMPCCIDLEEGITRSLHVPAMSVDCVDVRKSSFQMVLEVPDFPELPVGLRQLGMMDGYSWPQELHVARVKVPKHDQVFAELVVDDVLRAEWRGAGLTGAKFTSLTAQPAT